MPEKAIVVGTGFGGAVAACRLSQAGFAPLVLERGRRYEKSDFPALPHPPNLLPDLKRWTWKQEQGLWDIEDLDEIVSVQAAGYGGGSLIYANVHLRPGAEVFSDERWPKIYQNPETLHPYFNLVASMLGVAPLTEKFPDVDGKRSERMPAKARQLELLARKTPGQTAFFYPPLAVTYDETNLRKDDGVSLNVYGKEQGPCVSCGACVTGCPHGAKNTLDLNYLAVAEKFGARVKTECEVVAFHKADAGWAVEYIDHLTAEKVRVETQFLFLCAGSVHSTRLLARWLAHTPASQLKANVGVGYFPNADAIGMVYGTPSKPYPSWGPTITTSTVHTPKSSGDGAARWFMIQDGGYASELDRLLGAFRAGVWGARNRYKHLDDDPVFTSPLPSVPGSPPEESLAPRPDDRFMKSPVDGILDALAEGVFEQAVPNLFEQAVPRQLAGQLQPLFEKLTSPVLPEVVALTIQHALERKLRACFLTRWIDPKSRLFECLVRGVKSMSLSFLGGAEKVAGNAATAMIEFGGLSRDEVASRLLGYSSEGRDERLMLLAMGRDQAPGRLDYDSGADRVRADLDLFRLAPLYTDEEMTMRDIARAFGGELRVNPVWSFLGKPITVHSQGGCPMSDLPDEGVTTPDGQVHGHEGLYVLDGSVLCRSVGVNPSPTIAAIAERNIDTFLVKNATRATGKPWPTSDYVADQANADEWLAKAKAKGWDITPPSPQKGNDQGPAHSMPFGLAFDEQMEGFCGETNTDPEYDDTKYRDLENAGRPDHFVRLELNASVQNLAAFFEDMRHVMDLDGTIWLRVPGGDPALPIPKFSVQGTLQLMVADENGIPGPVRFRHKAHGLSRTKPFEEKAIKAQERLARFDYTSSPDVNPVESIRASRASRPQKPEQRFMFYDLSFSDGKKDWRLEGYKRMRDEPDVDAWRDTTWLFVRLMDPNGEASPSKGKVRAAGVVHVDMPGFIKQLNSLRVFTKDKKGDDKDPALTDKARIAWTIASFATFFFGNLQRIYLPQFDAVLDTFGRPPEKKRVSS